MISRFWAGIVAGSCTRGAGKLLVWLAGLWFVFFTSPAHAQRVSAALDREKILLGEQVQLILRAENIQAQVSPVSTWFELPDTVNHIEVVQRLPADTIRLNGITTYQQIFVLTSFDSGKWVLPPLPLYLQNKTTPLYTEALTLEVLPVDVSHLQDYHDLKDILEIEVRQRWLRYVILAMAVAAIAAFMYYLIKKRTRKKPPQRNTPLASLFEDTIAKLEALQKEQLPLVVFYTRLDDICRSYIQDQLHIRAKHLTQDELMVQLKVYMQQPEVSTAFYQLLRLVSAVKFAKFKPQDSYFMQSIHTAKTTVQYIHHHLQSTIRKHA